MFRVRCVLLICQFMFLGVLPRLLDTYTSGGGEQLPLHSIQCIELVIVLLDPSATVGDINHATNAVNNANGTNIGKLQGRGNATMIKINVDYAANLYFCATSSRFLALFLSVKFSVLWFYISHKIIQIRLYAHKFDLRPSLYYYIHQITHTVHNQCVPFVLHCYCHCCNVLMCSPDG